MAFAKNPSKSSSNQPKEDSGDIGAELKINMEAASEFVGAGIPNDYKETHSDKPKTRKPRKTKGPRKSVLIRYPVDIYEDIRELAHIQRTTIQEIVQEATEMVLKRPKNKKLLAEYHREQQD